MKESITNSICLVVCTKIKDLIKNTVEEFCEAPEENKIKIIAVDAAAVFIITGTLWTRQIIMNKINMKNNDNDDDDIEI